MAAYAVHHPSLFLDTGELSRVRDRVGRDPWRRICDRVIDSADSALRRDPRPSGGEGAPEGLIPLSRDAGAIRDLGLAFALTGEERYARRAASYLLAWSGGTPISFALADDLIPLCCALSAMSYGVDLLWRARGFTGQDKAQVARWMDDLVCELEPRRVSPRASIWVRLVYASVAFVVEDTRWMDLAYGGLELLLREVLEPGGAIASHALERETLQDALLTLKGLAWLAEAARHQRINLHHLEHDRRSLRLAFKTHAPFLLGQTAWPGRQTPAWESHTEVYEIAHRAWPDPEFAEVLTVRGRNVWDGRVLGPVSLTHGAEMGELPSRPAANSQAAGTSSRTHDSQK